MRIMVSGGGTAGHINPALAIAQTVRAKHPEAVIQYVGTPRGMESRLVPSAGFEFVPYDVKGFMRNKVSVKNIKYNISAVGCLIRSGRGAQKILTSFQPDIVVGTGGYVTGPLLLKAASMGIPTLTHEQNAYPGVTTKMLSRKVDTVLLAVPEAKRHLPPDARTVVTGNPIREAFLFTDRERARRELGIPEGLPCLLSFGGSLGAARINEAIADVMAWHCEKQNLYHIHATGRYGVTYLPELLAKRGVDPKHYPYLFIREFIDDMPRCLAAADLVISRAGAITLSELSAAGRGAILIPSPNVAENHQYHNAMALQKRGAAVVIEERALSGKRLCDEVERLIAAPDRLRTLGENARQDAILDASERIYREMMDLLRQYKPN